MASTHKLESGRYQVRWRDPSGRQRKQSFNRRADAVRFRRQIEGDIERGLYLDPSISRELFSTWASSWFATRGHLKPKTVESYEILLRVHIVPEFGDMPINVIDSSAVEGWVSRLIQGGLSPSRIRQAHSLLSQIMKSAVRSGRLARNPADGTSLPSMPASDRMFIDSDEIQCLVSHVPARHKTLIYIFAYGGLRWAEAVGLQRRSCDFLRHRLLINDTLSESRGKFYRVPTKSGRKRECVLPQFVEEALATHLDQYVGPEPEELVFTTEAGAPLRSSNFNRRVWQPALKEAHLVGLRIHDLRHTAAALLISEGAHARAVQAQLGHSTISTTMDIYGHLFPSDMDELAGRLDARHRSVLNGVAPEERPSSGLA